MTDLVEIGFVYTGGMEPLIRDTRKAKEEVEDLDKAQASLKRTEAQAEKVAGRLAMSLREKNNVLKAGIKGTRESIIAAKQENLANRLRAQGVDEKLIPSLQKLQKENLKLEETYRKSGKALGQSSVKMGQASIQLEQFLNQIQGGANPLLAFSQQSADLGIVLGLPLLGAVLGITGALVSFLGPALLDITDKTKALEKANDELAKSFSRVASGAGEVGSSFEQLRKQDAAIGILAVTAALSDARNQLRKTDKALEDFIESIDVLEAFRINGVGFGFSSLDDFATRLDEMGISVEEAAAKLEDLNVTAGTRLAGNFNKATQRLIELKDETDEIVDKFKLTDTQAISLGKSLGDLQNNVTYEGLDTLKATLTEIASSAQGNSFEFQKLTKDLLLFIKSAEDGKESFKLFSQEALGVNTKLRFDEDDSLSELQDKLNKINETLSKESPAAQAVYLKMIARLSQGIKEQSEEAFVSNTDRIKAEIRVQGVLGKSVEAQEADNWAVSEGITLSKERRNELIELLKVLNQPAETESYQESIQALDDQILTLSHGSAAVAEMTRNREMQAQVDRLYAVGLGELGVALEAQFEKYRRLKSAVDSTAASQKRFTDGLKESSKLLKDIAGSMDGVGNRIATSFSQGLDAITQFTSKSFELADAQKENSANLEFYNGKQDKTKADLMEIARLEEEKSSIQADNFQNQISGIGSILGASKSLFKEQSKEREILHRLEMGFLVAEMAMAAQKAVTNAIVAITNQGSGDPYSAFPRIAAMTAIMAGIVGAIGASISSGGGSAPTIGPSGTGTVLGDSDAQSESIMEGLSEFEDIQLDQLAELKGIRQGLGSLSGAINKITRDIVSAGGIDTGFAEGNLGTVNKSAPSAATLAGLAGAVFGPLSAVLSYAVTDILDKLTGGILSGLVQSIFGKTKTELVDSGVQFLSQSFADIIESGAVEANIFAVIKSTTKKAFGLIRNSEVQTQLDPVSQEFSEALGQIFVTMADTLVSAGDVLGITFKTFSNGVSKDLMESLEFLNLEAGGISLEGLSGEEIEEELSAFFSSMGDSMAEFLFPQLMQYQQINEGMFETVLRVTKETAIFNDVLRVLSVSMTNFSSIGFGQAVIEASGGLDNFTESFNTFYDEFFTEQEKAENTLRSLTEVFATLGLELPDTMEEFRDLVEETAAMGAAGADTLAILLEVSGAFAEMSEVLSDVEASSREAARSFADITSLLNAIRIESNTDILLHAGGSSEEARQKLVEDFGSAGAFGESFLNFADNFLGVEESLEVASETMAATLSGLFFDVTGQVADTTAEQNLIGLRDLIRTGSATSDDLIKFFAEMINGVHDEVEGITSLDIESGLLTGLLQVQPALNDYISLLQAQEQATQAAAEALDTQRLGLYVQLLEAQGNAEEALAITRSEELKVLDESLHGLQSLIWIQEDYNEALTKSEDILTDALSTLNTAISAQRDTISQVVNDLESAQNRLSGALRRQEVTRLGGIELATRELFELLGDAKSGDVSGQGLADAISSLDLSTLTAGDTSTFSTFAEFNLAQAKISTALTELNDITTEQLEDQRTELDAIDEVLANAEAQYNTMLGIEEDQVQQLINDGEYAAATDLALAGFLSAAIDTNGLLSLQDANAEQRFSDLLAMQASLIESGMLNADTLAQVAIESNGLLAQLGDSVLATTEDLINAQDATGDQVLGLADLQQALIDANGVNFQALGQLTDAQRQQIVDHLVGLTSTTSDMDLNVVAQINTSNILLTTIVEKLSMVDSSIKALDQTTLEIVDKAILEELKSIDDNVLAIVDKAILEELKSLDDNVLAIVDKAILEELKSIDDNVLAIVDKAILEELKSIGNNVLAIVDKAILEELKSIDDNVLAIADKAILEELKSIDDNVLAIADKAILEELKSIDDNVLAIADKAILEELKSIDDNVLAIVDKAILSELENINSNVVGIADKSMLNALNAISSNTYKTAFSLVNDDRRKVSLPNSHYTNQQDMVSLLGTIKDTLREQTSNNFHQLKSINKHNSESSDILQRIEINGLDTRVES
jgi:hypothetical protein